MVLIATGMIMPLSACQDSDDDDDDDSGGNDSRHFKSALVVVGQPDFSGNRPNQGGSADAGTLASPLGRPTAGVVLVPDYSNHRVLGFNTAPTVNNSNANFVVGQPDFNSTSSGAAANRLSLPSDSASDGTRLFVADMANNRVLIWNRIPSGNISADIVLGQSNFTANAPALTASGMSQPVAVAVAGGRLFVADQGNNRVLVWNQIPLANGTPADRVLGQPNFTTSTADLTASGMFAPASVWSDGQRVLVADAGHNRVLLWNSLPAGNGGAASVVIGQSSFTSGYPSVSASGLRSPFGVHSDGSSIYVADSGNNRVLAFDSFPLLNMPRADAVLGQSAFTQSSANDNDQDGSVDSHPTARTLNVPTAVFATSNRLYVTDRNNHRLLIFDKP